MSLSALYSGTLVSFISVPDRRSAINTVQDLVDAIESDEIRPIVPRGYHCYQYFLEHAISDPDSLYGKLGQRLQGCSNRDECFRIMLDHRDSAHRHAVIDSWIGAKIWLQIHWSEKHFHLPPEAESSLMKDVLAIAIRKNSPINKRFLDHILQELLEGGFIDRWKSMAMHNAYIQRDLYAGAKLDNEAEDDDTSEYGTADRDGPNMKLKLVNFMSILIIYSIGTTLSLLTLFIERVFARKHQQNSMNI